MASELTSQVLNALAQSDGPILSTEAFPSVPFITIKSALDRLASREMVLYKTIERDQALLTEEAQGIAQYGSHEAKVFEAVRKAVEGLKVSDLPVRGSKRTPACLGLYRTLTNQFEGYRGQRECESWTRESSSREMDKVRSREEHPQDERQNHCTIRNRELKSADP